MKVTAIIPDELVNEVKRMTGGATITDSLIIALKSYTSKQRLIKVMERVKKDPLVFRTVFQQPRFENSTERLDYI